VKFPGNEKAGDRHARLTATDLIDLPPWEAEKQEEGQEEEKAGMVTETERHRGRKP